MDTMQVVLFLACVGVATCAQALTGFAFGLILLGLVGMLQLAPLADAANVASVLTLVQASVVLRGSRKSIDLATLRDTALGSGIGVVIGVFLLGWLSGNVVLLLRVLLGVTILACATVLMARSAPLRERSSRSQFSCVWPGVGFDERALFKCRPAAGVSVLSATHESTRRPADARHDLRLQRAVATGADSADGPVQR